MEKHAILSASSAKKWLNCTGSVALEKQFPKQESEFAKEGTTAHKLAEIKIKKEIALINHNDYYKQKEALQIDDDMENYTENYSDFVLANYRKKKLYDDINTILELEKKVDYSRWAKQGFGTADALIIANNTIEVIDLKYGKGVKVDAQNNPQLMLYGLGALEAYDWLYDIKNIVMTIYQPRIDNISTFEMKAKALYEWGESIKEIAERAYSGKGECVAGKHCTEGFCRAMHVCKAFAEYAGSVKKYKEKEIETLTECEIAEVLNNIDAIVKWANAVKEYALQQMLNGTEFTGFKLVEGRKSRCYNVTDDEVAKILLQKGYTENVIYKKTLRSVSDMKKVLGADFDNILSEFVLIKRGAPTIARIEDKRPLYNSAESDFKDINVDTF